MTIDLVALIVFLIFYDNGSGKSSQCFCACSQPATKRGGIYLSLKLIVEVTTPQVYLFIFWWLPKRLLVSNFNESLAAIVITDHVFTE